MEDRKKMHTIPINRPLLLVLIAGTFALGVFVGRGAWLFSGGGQEEGGEGFYQNTSEEFRFIRLSIGPEGPADSRKIRELKPFRYKVNALIEEKLVDDEASSVSVYFRDLDNGNWFGIREDERLSPESRLKLPLMIAYFKWAEANPLVLRKRIPFTAAGGPEEPHYLKPPKTLEPGRSYSVNDLIYRMIAYGDNNAYALLAAHLPPKSLQRIFKDLYVNYDPSKNEDALSLSAYASFFRVLFNASYLSEEMSEKALRYLSRSTFRDGMTAGIPPDIDIASKAGERIIRNPGKEGPEELLQLHEFGVIYHPQRPFLLGITARGDDYGMLAAVIRDITRLIYAEVDRQSN